MYNEWDIYCIYRKVQANHNNRGYRLPKNGEYYGTNKLAAKSRYTLTLLTGLFNTKGIDISVERYFEAGFKVFKNLPYKQMLNKKIIKEYIHLDRIQKINDKVSKQSLTESARYVISKYGGFDKYCKQWHNAMIRQPVKDYIDNLISLGFLVFLNKYGGMGLTSEERGMLPNLISNNKQKIIAESDNLKQFLDKLNKMG